MKQERGSNYGIGIILGLFLPILGLILVLILSDDEDLKAGAIKGFLIGLIVGFIIFLFMMLLILFLIPSYSALILLI